jgi:NAD(P)-dependent dehydrogenase (short-subunit alcohol dehydrogenase family)
MITGANKDSATKPRVASLPSDTPCSWAGERRSRRPAIGRAFVHLDVTEDASANAAATWLEQRSGGLDVLINNAGIAGGQTAAPEVKAEDLRGVYETHVFGIVRVTHAMLPLLKASKSPVIVNVSSGRIVRGDDEPDPVRVEAGRARVLLVEVSRQHAYRAVRDVSAGDGDQPTRSCGSPQSGRTDRRGRSTTPRIVPW